VYGNQNNESAMSGRNESGYDLEKLLSGTIEGKDTHYPVPPGNVTLSRRARQNTGGYSSNVICMCESEIRDPS